MRASNASREDVERAQRRVRGYSPRELAASFFPILSVLFTLTPCLCAFCSATDSHRQCCCCFCFIVVVCLSKLLRPPPTLTRIDSTTNTHTHPTHVLPRMILHRKISPFERVALLSSSPYHFRCPDGLYFQFGRRTDKGGKRSLTTNIVVYCLQQNSSRRTTNVVNIEKQEHRK